MGEAPTLRYGAAVPLPEAPASIQEQEVGRASHIAGGKETDFAVMRFSICYVSVFCRLVFLHNSC